MIYYAFSAIMAYLYLTEPLFKGNNDLEMLDSIFSVRGTPSDKVWPAAKRFCSFGYKPKQNLSTIIKTASSEAIQFLDKLIALDPATFSFSLFF